MNYIEPRAGSYEGKAYTSVDHWATTSAVLHRPPKASAPPPPSPASPPPPSIPPYAVQPPPPSSPPPERIPGWVIQQLTDNSFGGAFGAIFLWLVLLLMSLGAYRAYQHREKLFESWQRPGAGLRMLEPLPEQPSSSFMPPPAPPQSGATARAD